MRNIKVSGARTHNLRNVSLEIPSEKITVISGISGSGKSSLAFDTIFAEGQRRYMENLSSYAKQIIGVVEKPDVDSIEGIPPAISIDQKSVSRSPRSTVGTLTESYDYLRLIFARFGEVRCPSCHKELSGGETEKIIAQAIDYLNSVISTEELEFKILAPIIKQTKGSQKIILKRLSGSGFKSFRIDGVGCTADELPGLNLAPNVEHTIDIQVYGSKIKNSLDEKGKKDLENGIRKALEITDGTAILLVDGGEHTFSRLPYCQDCKIRFPQIQPRLFSFNSPHGACHVCQGLGKVKKVSPLLVIPNLRLTIAEGAIRPWARLAGQNGTLMRSLEKIAQKEDFSLDVPVDQLTAAAVKLVLFGKEEFEGVIHNLERKYRETDSDYLRQEIEQYMVESVCAQCAGKRLNRFARSIYVFGRNICEMSDMEASDLAKLFSENLKSLPQPAYHVAQELILKLKNLETVGLEYLTLSRSSETISGGEAQRIRLGVQFDSFLSGVLYVLDEPTISLHSADTKKLISSFEKLKKEGNTLIVVEHDKTVISQSDYVFDIGPGAGKYGGQIIAQGTPGEIAKNPNSITGAYISGRKKIETPKKRRKKGNSKISIFGATHHNLKNIDVDIPLGLLISIVGVSGSGKSSLVYDIIAKAIAKILHHSADEPGKYRELRGVENLDKVIKIDQSPIGRTPRSNLATYTGVFTPIRELFAQMPQALLKNFQASQFSFNLKGGRCETCRGDGVIKIEMFFMSDVYAPCEECLGKRYSSETLEVKYKSKSIADVLEMSVDEAAEFFSDKPEIMQKLSVLQSVGLGYLPIGQSATTLSGGEAQRIKLASELSRPSTGKTMYILDEPTTGLHFDDIKKLLVVLQRLVDRGNTVLVIEHNLDVIKSADLVIEMGPGGGKKGGEIVFVGTPEEVVKNSASLTGKFLKEEL